MRRDVLRVGIGRLLLEIALGVRLATLGTEAELDLAIGLALAAALLAHLVAPRSVRRSFVAAHVALGAAALPVHLAPAASGPLLAIGLAVAIELVTVDLVQRRRLQEHFRTLRVPSSVLVRRLGSVVIVAVAARACRPLITLGARPEALASVFVVLGTLALLTAGFGAGPGRPVTRPIDAAIFALLASALAVPS